MELRRPGVVELRSSGALAEELGARLPLELPLPAPLGEVLRRAASSYPSAGRYLLRDESVVPAVYRDGRRVSEQDLIHSGDQLDLVIAIRGG